MATIAYRIAPTRTAPRLARVLALAATGAAIALAGLVLALTLHGQRANQTQSLEPTPTLPSP